MVYLAVAELALIVGLIWLRERSHDRELEAIRVLVDQHAVERAEHLSVLADLTTQTGDRDPHPDLTQMVGIVDRLCQRIQAPDQAVIDHSIVQPLPEMPQPALPDDDAAFWKAQGFAPAASKEELAEAYAGD